MTKFNKADGKLLDSAYEVMRLDPSLSPLLLCKSCKHFLYQPPCAGLCSRRHTINMQWKTAQSETRLLCDIYSTVGCSSKNEKLNLSKFPRSATARPPWLLVVPSARLIFDQEPRHTTLQFFSPAPFFEDAQIKSSSFSVLMHNVSFSSLLAPVVDGCGWANGMGTRVDAASARVAAEMTNDRVEELSPTGKSWRV